MRAGCRLDKDCVEIMSPELTHNFLMGLAGLVCGALFIYAILSQI